MSELELDHWLNLASETQMMTLGTLLGVARSWLGEPGPLPQDERVRAALAVFEGRQRVEDQPA